MSNFANLREYSKAKYITNYRKDNEVIEEFTFQWDDNVEVDGRTSFIPGIGMKNGFTSISTKNKDIKFELNGTVILENLPFKITNINHVYNKRNLKFVNSAEYYLSISLER